MILALLLASAVPQIPDSKLTPGVFDPSVTKEMVCQKGGYTNKKGVRNVPESVKKVVFAEYHINPKSDKFEIDHLISLELGGMNDQKNLWPQSYTSTPYNAHVKDALEDRLHAKVCHGEITIQEAQHEIVGDWTIAYRKYFPGK